jgi:beta-galactosidase
MLCAQTHAQRRVINLKQWQFSRDKVEWQNVTVPHDWAISGPFDKKWDLQTVRIEQNGEKVATEKSGRSGSLPWIGKGYYKCTVHSSQFTVGAKRQNDSYELCFDGAMSEPTVYVNGKKAGYWAYGYNAFRLDVTDLVKDGNNLIEVELENKEESSRWYPGAGLYRPVELVITPKTHIDPWATYIRTVGLKEGVDNHGRTEPQATIDYKTQLVGADFGDIACVVEILNSNGFMEAGSHFDVPADGVIETELTLSKPMLWTPETPYLYKVRTRLFKDHKVIDETVTNLGVRTVSVSKEGGFQLNGVTRKIKGVCLHHDLGPLGAAVNKAALIRQVKLMKEMGCDAIRTAHNMPSTMQMDVCDSLGMMVMAESFDMWIYPKCKNGYARFFTEWAEKDITNLVLNHRNHPSIVMWSIGNEIPEQWDKNAGVEWATKLQNLCHELDPTRPVTQGMDRVDNALKSGFAEVMDVVGLNYRDHKYDKAWRETSKGFILGSETASTVSSRGVYKLPYTATDKGVYADGQCSSYDNEWCSWSNLPDMDFEDMDDLPYTIGQFVWTGIDYLGEPTPYDEYWPSRSSYFGICDLAGLPKDRYYLYRSVWNKQEHTLHIAPHWNWGKKMVGKTVPVQVYSDYDEAELFINGKSQGRIKKSTEKNPAVGKEKYIPNLDRYRLRWMNVKYEPGEVKVIAYDKNGNEAMVKTMRTAGEADHLLLEADRATIKADGEDLCYVTVSMMDKDGNLCPLADDQLTFDVAGEGVFQCACNGDATSLEPFTKPTMKLFNGKLVVTVRSTKQKGTLTLTAKTGDKESSVTIHTK